MHGTLHATVSSQHDVASSCCFLASFLFFAVYGHVCVERAWCSLCKLGTCTMQHQPGVPAVRNENYPRLIRWHSLEKRMQLSPAPKKQSERVGLCVNTPVELDSAFVIVRTMNSHEVALPGFIIPCKPSLRISLRSKSHQRPLSTKGVSSRSSLSPAIRSKHAECYQHLLTAVQISLGECVGFTGGPDESSFARLQVL